MFKFMEMFSSFWLFSLLVPMMLWADGDDDGGGGDGGDGGSNGNDDGGGSGGNGDSGGDDGGGSDGSGPLDNWYKQIPENYAIDPSISRFKDQPIDEVLKSFINAKKMVGADKIALLGEDATPEQQEEFYKALGRPDDYKDYELNTSDEIPEGMRYSKTFTDNFMKSAMEAGISKVAAQKQWASLTKASMDLQSRSNADTKAKTEEGIRGLKNELGAAYDQKMELGKKAARVIAKETGTDFDKMVESGGLMNDPVIAKVLMFMGDQFSEDQIGGASNNMAMTNLEAKAEIEELKADPAYFDTKNPKHKNINIKIKKLYQLAYPDE